VVLCKERKGNLLDAELELAGNEDNCESVEGGGGGGGGASIEASVAAASVDNDSKVKTLDLSLLKFLPLSQGASDETLDHA